MKKKTLLFTLIAGMLYLGVSSYTTGPALNGYNRTGAKGGISTNCGDAGCHGGASANTTATITVDSAGGVPVTSYVAGMTYTITVTGTNTTLTHFGFQFAAVSGSGTSQIQAGSFSSLPTLVANHVFTAINFIEHTSQIAATSGTTFTKTFTWTAPTPAVGSITMYLTVNAVNNDNNANAADVSGNVSKVLTHSTSAVSSVTSTIGLKAFPNPVSGNLSLQLDNAQAGTYTVNVYDLNGKNIASQLAAVSSAAQITNISTASWAPGMYVLSVENGSSRQVISVVKQ